MWPGCVCFLVVFLSVAVLVFSLLYLCVVQCSMLDFVDGWKILNDIKEISENSLAFSLFIRNAKNLET